MSEELKNEELNEDIVSASEEVGEVACETSSVAEGQDLEGNVLTWKEKRKLKKAEKARKEAEKTLFQNVCEMVAYTAFVLCLALIVKNYIGQPIIVDGNSMNDTLNNKDFVWANKIGYTPERFDVVIVTPYSEGMDSSSKINSKTLFIKRVIALPGETIYIDNDDVIHIKPADSDEFYTLEDPYGYFGEEHGSKLINLPRGLIVVNNNISAPGYSRIEVSDTESYIAYTLSEGEYFCMGDNRYDSTDSRFLGGFSREQIKGHAVARIWPLNLIGNFDKSNK